MMNFYIKIRNKILEYISEKIAKPFLIYSANVRYLDKVNENLNYDNFFNYFSDNSKKPDDKKPVYHCVDNHYYFYYDNTEIELNTAFIKIYVETVKPNMKVVLKIRELGNEPIEINVIQGSFLILNENNKVVAYSQDKYIEYEDKSNVKINRI